MMIIDNNKVERKNKDNNNNPKKQNKIELSAKLDITPFVYSSVMNHSTNITYEPIIIQHHLKLTSKRQNVVVVFVLSLFLSEHKSWV